MIDLRHCPDSSFVDAGADLGLDGKAVVDMGKDGLADCDQRRRIEGDKGISRLPLGGERRYPPRPSSVRP